MCPEENNLDGTTEIAESSQDAVSATPQANSEDSKLGGNWARRKFLGAAALGVAAAAFLKGEGSHISVGPLAAYAHDISTFQCTANDVRIIGVGQVINEPCTCTGTFNATVQFTVENNAASARNCITLHLCPVTLPGGGTFDPGDVFLQGTIEGKTTQVMTGTINNYPCGSGLLCFGEAITEGRGRCDAGTCCSTITWGVPGQDTCPPDRLISSKCRHQQICIQGRGNTTLTCNPCTVECGGNSTLTLSTSSAASLGPFTYSLSGLGTTQTAGPTSSTSQNFTVGPITETTTFTGTITDASGCAKSATVTVTTTPITASLAVSGNTGCNNGQLTFTASPSGTGTTFVWRVDGVVVSGQTAATFLYNPTLVGGVLDTGCHTVSVTVTTAGGCDGTATNRVTQCVTSTVATGACPAS